MWKQAIEGIEAPFGFHRHCHGLRSGSFEYPNLAAIDRNVGDFLWQENTRRAH
jgi:hypothetical protein